MIVAQDYPDFAAAMTKKLVQEIGATPLTLLEPDRPIRQAAATTP